MLFLARKWGEDIVLLKIDRKYHRVTRILTRIVCFRLASDTLNGVAIIFASVNIRMIEVQQSTSAKLRGKV